MHAHLHPDIGPAGPYRLLLPHCGPIRPTSMRNRLRRSQPERSQRRPTNQCACPSPRVDTQSHICLPATGWVESRRVHPDPTISQSQIVPRVYKSDPMLRQPWQMPHRPGLTATQGERIPAASGLSAKRSPRSSGRVGQIRRPGPYCGARPYPHRRRGGALLDGLSRNHGPARSFASDAGAVRN